MSHYCHECSKLDSQLREAKGQASALRKKKTAAQAKLDAVDRAVREWLGNDVTDSSHSLGRVIDVMGGRLVLLDGKLVKP